MISHRPSVSPTVIAAHLGIVLALTVIAAGCSAPPPAITAQSVLLITIDTLRADHLGSYGRKEAHTPTLDAIARDGVRFDRAWATAPITLPSHASLITGLYPPRHGARHNGIAVNQAAPTLATVFKQAGIATAAFVSAFPLDRRFGLNRGFDTYDDELPRSADGHPLNERAGSETVSRALAWLQAHPSGRFFLWVHLFEPHAPYGSPGSGASAEARYDYEITIADREAGRLLAGLGDRSASTLVVATADHGEAFGEHGEIGHSVFVYDTTLRVPLLMRGAGISPGAVVHDDVSLVDVAPTILAITGLPALDGDGVALIPVIGGRALPPRVLYAESFAPQFDFGWAGLQAVRDGNTKLIAAPKGELYDLASDPGESANRFADDSSGSARLQARLGSWPAPQDAQDGAPPAPVAEATRRLRSLGYLSGGGAGRSSGAPSGSRPDPKDRIAIASRMAMVTSGEVTGDALVAMLETILRDDPQNAQAHLRLGFAEIGWNHCDRAEPHLRFALSAGVPSADAGLGLAGCRGRAGDLAGAASALAAARATEPGNPVVAANLGLLAMQQGRLTEAIAELEAALTIEPRLLEARFALARALARSGNRPAATAAAQELLRQLPAEASQRAEVERLLSALR